MASNAGDASGGSTPAGEPSHAADAAMLAAFPPPGCFTAGSNLAEDVRFMVQRIATATKLVGLGEAWLRSNAAVMDTFCSRLPPTLKKCLNNSDLRVWSERQDVHADMFEMVCGLVEFVLAMQQLVGNDRSKLPLLVNLVLALHVAVDTENMYYKMRSEGRRNQILMRPRRWVSALEICGLSVRRFGAPDADTYTPTCRLFSRRVGGVAEVCPDCTRASEFDAVIVHLGWQLANNQYGDGYCWIFDVLKSYREYYTFQNLGILLQPFALLRCSFDIVGITKKYGKELRGMGKGIFQFIQKTFDDQERQGFLSLSIYASNTGVDLMTWSCKVTELSKTISKKSSILQAVVQTLLDSSACFANQLGKEQLLYELIVASILDGATLSAFSTQLLESVLGWLELLKVPRTSTVIGKKLVSIFKKLPVCDKERKHERRLLHLAWRHMVLEQSEESISKNDFVEFLSNFADHYTIMNDKEELQDAALQSEDIAKLLESCFNEEYSSSYNIKVQERTHVDAYVQVAKRWESDEHAYLGEIPARERRLQKLLDFKNTLKRQEVLRDCIQWLSMARNLTTDIDNFSLEALGTARDSVLLPAVQTLEALKQESLIHFQIGQKFEDLNAKQLQDYTDLKVSYYQSLKTLFERCLLEKADVVKEALCSTAKVATWKERARVSTSDEGSSHNSLKKMLQNVEPLLNSVNGKRNLSSTDAECVICYTGFNESRKRACLGPCGHAQACLQCANIEYARTKRCPICQCCIEKPIPLNSRVFL